MPKQPNLIGEETEVQRGEITGSGYLANSANNP